MTHWPPKQENFPFTCGEDGTKVGMVGDEVLDGLVPAGEGDAEEEAVPRLLPDVVGLVEVRGQQGEDDEPEGGSDDQIDHLTTHNLSFSLSASLHTFFFSFQVF